MALKVAINGFGRIGRLVVRSAKARKAPLDFVANVNVVRLVEMAPHHQRVPDLFESYNRACPPVELPDFLKALATLVAKGMLVSR